MCDSKAIAVQVVKVTVVEQTDQPAATTGCGWDQSITDMLENAKAFNNQGKGDALREGFVSRNYTRLTPVQILRVISSMFDLKRRDDRLYVWASYLYAKDGIDNRGLDRFIDAANSNAIKDDIRGLKRFPPASDAYQCR